ncbi:hypothetical protein R1flu_004767 [Riccia fluitans]|uniref:Cyanovirin-N domain-containing protein n=1 Tax=Riccia fluitans TaxID=41844 RepID=A0ABD1YR87_9MARC
MARPNQILLAVVLTTYLIDLIPAEAQGGCGGFSRTCTNVTIDDRGRLRAACEDVNNDYAVAEINLNYYVGEEDGVLVPNSSDFVPVCPRKSVRKPDHHVRTAYVLEAECTTSAYLLKTTTLAIDYWISNNDGRLIWNSCY